MIGRTRIQIVFQSVSGRRTSAPQVTPSLFARYPTPAALAEAAPAALETVVPDGDGLQEVVGDEGYHSNQELIDLEAVGIRSYISEPGSRATQLDG